MRVLRSTGRQGPVAGKTERRQAGITTAGGSRTIALPISINGYEPTAHALFTFKAAVLEWDEPSAWAEIWALAFASGLLLASVLPWESK